MSNWELGFKQYRSQRSLCKQVQFLPAKPGYSQYVFAFLIRKAWFCKSVYVTTFRPMNSIANELCKLWQGQSLNKTLAVNPGRPSRPPALGGCKWIRCPNTFQAPVLGVPGGHFGALAALGSRLRPGRALHAPRAPPAPAPAARKAPRPRLEQIEGLPGWAAPLFSFFSAATLPERSVDSLEQGRAGLRSCCSLCSGALVKLMPVSAQSGYLKLLESIFA